MEDSTPNKTPETGEMSETRTRIDEYLAAHPTPWAVVVEDGCTAINDANGDEIDYALNASFAEFVAAFVNTHAGAPVESDTLNSALRDAIANRDAHCAAHTNTLNELNAARSEMSELHDIIDAQRSLIDSLQRRLARKEAR